MFNNTSISDSSASTDELRHFAVMYQDTEQSKIKNENPTIDSLKQQTAERRALKQFPFLFLPI